MPRTTHAMHLIDGDRVDGPAEKTVTAPSGAGPVGSIAYGDADTAERAADAAARAFPAWAAKPARERGDVLLHAADRVEEVAPELGLLLAREAGKRVMEAEGEVRMGAEYLRWAGQEVRRLRGQVVPNEAPARRHVVIHQPAGVALSLTPWNFPVSIQARKLGPALAAGCSVVARVSEKAPLAASRFIELIHEAGLPDGVLNLVHGPARKVTDTLLAHPAVRVVSFTGSTPVGAAIMATAARRIVRPLLELGGDAPFIVFDDADLDQAVEQGLLAKFRNNGQSCIAANRFLVHRSLYDRFVQRMVDAVDAMRIGDPVEDAEVDLGPLIDQQRVDEVDAMVTQALEKGATRLTARRELPGDGSYGEPALLGDVPDDSPLSCEEVFGPVAAISSFDDEEEAIARANATEMGLAAYLFTRDVGRAWRVGEALEAGIIGVNAGLPSVVFAPMGGMKASGLGREGADIGIEEYTEAKYLAVGL
jgi:succinate-semialdehyde dehydrogenase / glutarate-semialdehyde dehydrogenase